MYTPQRLSERIIEKRRFNVSKKEDRILAYKFLITYSWRGLTPSNSCPFFCEYPYIEIPAMLKDKIVEFYRHKEMKDINIE